MQDTAITRAARAANIRLFKFGKVYIDAMGQEPVRQAFRTLKKMNSYVAKLVTPFHGAIGFYPEQLVNETSKGEMTIMRIHARPLNATAVVPVDAEGILFAPASDERITSLSTALKARVAEENFARMAGLGPPSINRMMKALVRANVFLARESEESGSERTYMWAIPAEMQLENKKADRDDLTSLCFDVVKGPIL